MAMRNPYAAYKQQARISENKKAAAVLSKRESSETEEQLIAQTESQESTIKDTPETREDFHVVNMPSRPDAKDPKIIQKENPYLFNAVMTASPEELTSLLYGGAIKFMKQARTYTKENKISEANHANQRAQAIFGELISSLDMEGQTDMSRQLYDLYEYINYNLVAANMKKDHELIEQMIEFTNELRTTWQEAIKITKSKKSSN